MSVYLKLDLAPLASMVGTPSLQRYVRGTADAVGASTGAAIVATVDPDYASRWWFDVTGLDGDWYGRLSNVNVGTASPPFPFRVDSTSAYWGDSWLYLDLIEAAGAVSGPVASTGQITSPIVIGDDYLAANGRAFQWTIAAITGYVLGTSTCKFGGCYLDNTWLVTGTVSDAGGGNWTLSFDLPKATTADLEEGYYSWSVEVISAGGTEVTRVRSGRNVLLVDKQT